MTYIIETYTSSLKKILQVQKLIFVNSVWFSSAEACRYSSNLAPRKIRWGPICSLFTYCNYYVNFGRLQGTLDATFFIAIFLFWRCSFSLWILCDFSFNMNLIDVIIQSFKKVLVKGMRWLEQVTEACGGRSRNTFLCVFSTRPRRYSWWDTVRSMTLSTAVTYLNIFWDGDSRVADSSYFLSLINELCCVSSVRSRVQSEQPLMIGRYRCRTEPMAYRNPSSCVPVLYVSLPSICMWAADLFALS